MTDIVNAAMRNLSRMRCTGALVVLTLAAGIAANLVVFALVNAAFLRPLPFADPQRLVALDDRIDGKSLGVSWGEVQQWERAPGLFDGVAASSTRTWALTDRSGAGMEVVLSGMVTPGFFQVLGTRALVGATFSSEESAATDQHRVVISYRLWRTRYRGEADITARTVQLNDVPYQIAGVLPDSFRSPSDSAEPDVYIPLSRQDYCCQLNQRGREGVARLAPGVSLASANRHLEALGQIEARSEGLRHFGISALDLQSFIARDRKKTLLLLWLSILALGLVAAFNAAALLLAHALRHLRQYALKISLGAAFWQLLREQIGLAVTISVVTDAAALVLSRILLYLIHLSPAFEPVLRYLNNVTLWDWRVFALCTALSLAACIIACVAPLVVVRGSAMQLALRSHSGLTASRGARLSRTALVVAQLGFSVMLFTAVSSFGHSLYILLAGNPGFRTQGVVMAGIGVPEARYNTDEKMVRFHEQALASMRAIPGVGNAGFGAGVPIHPLQTGFLLDGFALEKSQRPRVALAIVSPQIFPILQLPIVHGRNFASTDRLDAPYVAIVNQAFVRRYLNPTDPLASGMQVQFYNGNSMRPWSHFQIVGIVADSRSRSLDRAPEPEIYLCTQQVPLEGGEYFLDTPRAASSLTAELPTALWHNDPEIQRLEPLPLQAFLQSGFSDQRATLYLSVSFALISLSLAALGLGAGISAGVSETTKEIGIRCALGESRRRVAARILRGSLVRTLLGTAIGIGGSLWLSRIVTVSVDRQFRFDPQGLPLVVVVMPLIGVLVTVFPIWRALRISPVESLRAE